jgi:hypothetical protein
VGKYKPLFPLEKGGGKDFLLFFKKNKKISMVPSAFRRRAGAAALNPLEAGARLEYSGIFTPQNHLPAFSGGVRHGSAGKKSRF